jgi:3',5'-cyclic AMP phosphodiesterase CpdA
MLSRRNFLKTGGLLTAGLAVGQVGKAQDATPAEKKAIGITTKPYLQNLTPESVTIMWITSNSTSHSRVEYGEGNQLNLKAYSVTRGLIQTNSHIHKITLRNLKPATTYSYKIYTQEILVLGAYNATVGDTVSSDILSFTTPGLYDEKVSALIFNDIHNEGSKFGRMVEKSGLTDYDFMFLNGDMINDTTDESRIVNSILNPCSDILGGSKPFITVRGNHETRNLYARSFFDYFQMGDDNKGYFSFTRGPVFFIALDSGEDKEDNHAEYFGLAAFDAFREEQVSWLEQQLQSDAAIKAKFKVVLMHIPPYHSGDWHGTLHCRQLFTPLFEKYGIAMLISGHTHHYGVHLPDNNHSYPVIIGGGTGVSADISRGNTTVIKLLADTQSLKVEMIDYNGNNVAEHSVDAK